MRKVFKSFIACLCVISVFGMTACKDKKDTREAIDTRSTDEMDTFVEITTEQVSIEKDTQKNEASKDYNNKDFSDVNYIVKGNTHKAIRDVFIRDKEFIDTDNGGKKTILTSFCLVDGTNYDEEYFSVVDTDKDGYYEVFVRQNSDLYVVFKHIDGEVYSYQIQSDRFLNNDGIMFDNGTYFVPEFTVDGYTRFELAHSEKTDDGEKFYVGNKLVEYDDFARFTSCDDISRNARKYYGTNCLDYFAKEEKDYVHKFVKDYTSESVVPDEIVDVLLYDKEFTYRSEYYESDDDKVIKYARMSDFKDIYGSDPEAVRKVESYMVVDIDQDGYSEVVVYMQYPGDDVIVLHCDNGVVYGYKFVFRAAQWIAPGGYLHGSSGAADNDSYTLVFNKDKYTQVEKCGTESDGTYYVDGVQVTKEEYIKAYDEVWGEGILQEYDSLLLLLNLTDKR